MKTQFFIVVWSCLVGSLLGQFVDDFNTESSANWLPKNPTRWTASFEYGRIAFYINTTDYNKEPPDKLGEYALLKDRVYGDFSFSCLVRSRDNFTENPTADFAVIFGFQDNANYYYMMFNRLASETKLYKIQSNTRVAIAEAESCWILDNNYHIVEVVRSGGMIAVKYDGRLVLTAYDMTLGSGNIGIGSYNDAAAFDDVRISESPIEFDRWIRLTAITPFFSLTDPAAHKKIRPVIDVTPEGKLVIAWQETINKQYLPPSWRDIYRIYAQVFSQKGMPLTDRIPINEGYGISPSIAAGPDRFVVSWTDFGSSFPLLDNFRSVNALQVSLTGTPISSYTVSVNPGGMWKQITEQTSSSIAYLGEGKYRVAWNERPFFEYHHDILATGLSGNINTEGSGDQMNPSIVTDGSGRMLVTWDDKFWDPSAIMAQALTQSGRVGGNFRVNQATSSHAKWNALASNQTGKAFVTWTLEEGRIMGRRCQTDGTLQGGEVVIGDGSGRTDVSVNRLGQACVVWETTEEGPSHILARIMREEGTWLPGSFHLHPASGAWHFPKIAFWENCLYAAFENRQDSSITIGVFLVDHRPLNYNPYLISTRQDTAVEDQPYTYVPQALDPNGDALSFSFESYPHWLTPSNGSLSGTPRGGDRDTSFVVVVSDGVSSIPVQVFLTVIPVNDPPQFVSPDSAVAVVGEVFSYTARAVDEENDPLVYTFSEYPAWLSPLDSVISGLVPSDAHDFSFNVRVSDGALADTLTVRVRVLQGNRPPQITRLKDFTFLETKTFTIWLDTCAVDDGPVEALAWEVHPEKDSLLVSWEDRRVTFSSSGWHGQTGVLFTVTDPEGASDSLRIVVRVLQGNRPPQITRLKDFTFLETETFTIWLDTCAVDDGPVEALAWEVHPEKDSLLVSWEDRRVTFSSSGWHGQTGVLFTVTDPEGASDSLRIEVRVMETSGIAALRPFPTAIRLYPVYPNPFNPTVLIRFDLPATTECVLSIYNLKGERLVELSRGEKPAGSHAVTWNAAAFSSGTYLIRLEAGGLVQIQKALLVK